MSSLQIGRLLLAPPLQFQEQAGDPVTNLGGAAIPAPRAALRHSVSIATLAADGDDDSVGGRLTLRRQLRSMLNNTPLKLAGGLFVIYSDDPEQDGWYVIDQGQFSDGNSASGLATGFWQVANFVWMKAGTQRTNREARSVWAKDLRTGLNPRDVLRQVYSTDFSLLPGFSVIPLPNGANNAINAVTGQVVGRVDLNPGWDGGAGQIALQQPDLAVISFERAESSMNLADVVVYDRQGQITAPAVSPDTSWEEVYGPDWPWSASVASPDTPVLDNGVCRVRWDPANTPGFKIDVWNGTAYVEQGKMLVYRVGDSNHYDDTWVAASLVEWLPDRAVAQVTLSTSGDPWGYERVYVTMLRGAQGVRFEVYPALESGGGQADVLLLWQVAAVDANDSIIKIDSQTVPPPRGAGAIIATAGSGSTAFPSAYVGASSFASSENDVALLRYSTFNVMTPYQANFAVLQAAGVYVQSQSDTTGYGGAARNSVFIASQGGQGYLSLHVSFAATASDQVQEAEAIRNASGTTASVSDSTASGLFCVSDTQTAATNNTLYKAITTLLQAKYRIFARCKTSSGGVTGSFAAYLSGVTAGTVTLSSTTWKWLDMGEVLITTPPPSNAISFVAWSSAGGGTVYVDRLEMVLLENRTAPGYTFTGCRDLGQSVLFDSRVTGAVVAR